MSKDATDPVGNYAFGGVAVVGEAVLEGAVAACDRETGDDRPEELHVVRRRGGRRSHR